jgi:hypothetical protein
LYQLYIAPNGIIFGAFKSKIEGNRVLEITKLDLGGLIAYNSYNILMCSDVTFPKSRVKTIFLNEISHFTAINCKQYPGIYSETAYLNGFILASDLS